MWLSNSSIGRKVVMSVTGIALVLFLTFHMAMNLVALFSEDAYNMICEFLGANWYALVATAGLAALFEFHIIYAFWLTMQNRAARGSERYAVNVKPKNCGMGISEHACPGYYRHCRIGSSLCQFLVQNAVCRNYRCS